MKRVCLLCERTSADANLWCQEAYCPAEMSPTILDYGEWLSDIEIIKPVIVLRSAVLYEATHQDEKVFLKVAHPGEENKERLQREAEFLRDTQLNKEQFKFLPILLPPYAYITIADDAYGKAMLRNHLLYFYMFEFVEGEPLRDILAKRPQLWINHIGWLIISLSHTISFLHSKEQFHFCLGSESVLVRFDKKPSVPRILLFDLGVVSNGQHTQLNNGQPHLVHTRWQPDFVLPAHTAPELVKARHVHPNPQTDVYGLGLILYEMLVGEPPFTFKLNSDEDVYRAIEYNQRVKMNREDVREIADIAIKATQPDFNYRYTYPADLAGHLVTMFGETPLPKKNWLSWFSLNRLLIIAGTLFLIAFLVASAVLATESG